ncbi:retrovirus-related pol polyprotein from transposon TNT 1-94 [Tanacetum coccineum]
MNEDKVKKDIEQIETINIELNHRVSKLIAENEHLKQTYKQLYDSIKPTRIQSKDQCDALVSQVNQKSVEISNLNVSLQEKDLVITALKNELRKLKRKDLADNVVTKHTIAPEMLKVDELLIIIRQTCPSINNSSDKLVAVTPKNKDKRVRFTEPVTSSGNINIKTASSSNLVSNKPMLSSTGVKPSTSASGSQPSGNTKKDKIQRTPRTANVQRSKLNANFELLCVKCNGCMLSDNHDLCVLNLSMMITTTTEVPLRKPTTLENDTPKPVVTLVYSWKPKKSKTNVPVSKPKIIKSISANNKEPNKSWGSIVSDVPSSSLDECRLSKLFFGIDKFGNDHVAKIMGYSDDQIGNVIILKVYYVEGLSHNLFFVGQFYDSNLEVAFRQHTYFIRNLEGVDLLTGSRGNNLYTRSLRDMMASSPICLLSKASKTNKKKPHKPKSEDTNQEKLYLLHLELCGPMHVASVNGKKYIIIDDYSRFTWVKCLRSKDEAPDFIIKFLKMIQVRLKAPI